MLIFVKQLVIMLVHQYAQVQHHSVLMVHVENVEVPQIVQEITRSAVVVFVKHLLVVVPVRVVVVVFPVLIYVQHHNSVLIICVLNVEIMEIVLEHIYVLVVYVHN